MAVDTRKEEAEILNLQLIATLLFIIALVVSIFLNLNEKYKLLYREGIISDKEAINLLKTNRIFIVALFITYLYLAYRDREIDKINNKDLTADNLEIFVSVLSVIGGLIILYLVFNYDQDTTAIYENPTL
jgi:divalent metal cation (Fe/Co/Zn/Cd) transporter